MLKKVAKISKNPKDTERLAASFLEGIVNKGSKKALVVGLSGELGTGKTTFTQFVAKYLGIKRKASSPTFVIMKKYPIKHGQYKFLFHLDAYRLKNEKELLHLGWEEIIGNKEHLVFIEWPENVKKIIPRNSVSIEILHTENGHRTFKINKSKML
ncbi:MAG: tRNA (adenosine(37)-N6)-threonylcarbamoyltransferase complex ATPase subunit type 1 TsaE [Candidatus Paceibacterota bacterium]|jgi:tRNA threonylcarbamoyladenosine biosynthesis protein TsaE